MRVRFSSVRVRTLMGLVALVAFFLWGATIGWRMFDHYRHMRLFAQHERAWRGSAARNPSWAVKGVEIADYFARLVEVRRRAMMRPWAAFPGDEHAPGYDEWVERNNRAGGSDRDLTPSR